MQRLTVIVSACLAGVCCRYDGKDKKDEALLSSLKDTVIIPVCPERLGGLPTPRKRAEINSGDGFAVLGGSAAVIDADCNRVTDDFLSGAAEALEIAVSAGAKKAYPKENSPSCGVGYIKRNGKTVKGCGVFTALLKTAGIEVAGV